MDWPYFILAIALSFAAAFLLLRMASIREQRVLGKQFDELLKPGFSPELARPELFHSLAVADLPDPAQRYFRWSIKEGAELKRIVRLRMSGRIRLARGKEWIALDSEELLVSGRGFLWQAATAGRLRIRGYDRYTNGTGEMRWRLWGLVPVMSANGEQITRSARWRFAAEHFLLPSSLLPRAGVRWQGLDDQDVLLTVFVDGEPHEMQLNVDMDGMPRKVLMQRWGNMETEGGEWQPIPYAIRFEGVYRKKGYSLPHQVRASWWAGTEKELLVVELEIEDVEFQ